MPKLAKGVVLASALAIAGCADLTTTQQRTLTGGAAGAAAGAGIGALAGDAALGAAIGGAIGTAGGYLFSKSQGE